MKKYNIFTIISSYLAIFILLFGFWFYISEITKLPQISKDNLQNAKLQSVSYAPFKNNENPVDLVNGLILPDERIDKDLEQLSKQFESIRIYSVSGLERVPYFAKKHGLKVLLGAWVCNDEKITQKELQKAVELAREYPDIVRAVVVGNETLLRREISGQKLGGYIKWVKERLPNTPVTYADVWEFWLQNPNLAPLVDFITIHILPYWEDNPVSIEEALGHISQTRGHVEGILKNKKILIGETGWPSEGRMRGGSLPSPISQAKFFRGFLEESQKNGWEYNLIEAYDQPWKRASEGAVGGYWGLYDKDSNDKNSFFGEVSEYKNYLSLFFLSCIFVIFSFILAVKGWLREGYFAKSLFFIGTFSFLGSVLLTLSINQYLIIVKNNIDFLQSLLLVSSLMLLYYLIIYYLIFGDKILLNKIYLIVERFLTIIVIFIITFLAISLAYDGRYRSFENYSLALAVIVFFIKIVLGQKDLIYLPFKKFATLTIVSSAFVSGFFEGILNFQSIVWSLLLLVFGIFLWQESKGASLRSLQNFAIFAIISLGVLYLFRQGVFLNSEYVAICEKDPKNFICILRGGFGYVVYHQFLGYASILIVVLFWILRDFRASFGVGFLSLFVSIGAILFFNSNLGAIAFLGTIFLILQTFEPKLQSQ